MYMFAAKEREKGEKTNKQGNKKRAMKSICTNTRYSSDYKQVIIHSSKHVNSFQTTGNLELQEGHLFEKLAKSPPECCSLFLISLQTISEPQRKPGNTTSS